MRIHASLVQTLNLSEAAEHIVTRRLDHFPALIIDRCLQTDTKLLAKYISSSYVAGTPVPAEILTMPRKGFGPRPVVITSAPARILYHALVSAIQHALPAPSRAPGNWDRHKRFGLGGDYEYVVELDIASCYEYIDHRLLKDELLLRSMNLEVSEAIDVYLGDLLGQSRGIPQMQSASDLLADTYLSLLDRKLARSGYMSSRYADDIRVAAPDWETANSVIEQVAEMARQLGLILSSEKTAVFKASTLIDQDQEDANFFDKYFYQARDALTQLIVVGAGPYGEDEEVVEIAPEDKAAAQEAAWLIFHEWWDLVKKQGTDARPSGPQLRFLSSGLIALYDYKERIPDALLKDLVFHYPARLEQVSRYIVARGITAPSEDSLHSIYTLANMGRQSAWSKLWLLHAIESVPRENPSVSGAHLLQWVLDQLADRHETVRAQAAWLCSTIKQLTSAQLSEIYLHASPISHAALAAATARQENLPKQVVSAIIGDSPLNEAAGKWATAES